MERETSFRIIQSIMTETTFPKSDQVAKEDEMFYRLGELAASGLMDTEEAQDTYDMFVNIFGD